MITDKIKTREDLSSECARLRQTGKALGFTSGAFDLLHAGHVDYLEKARALCDVLIAGVNSDESIRSYKGKNRPVIPQDQRIKVVAALESVDYAFLFDETDNKRNIERLRPDWYIKAGDYRKEDLGSASLVESYGGRVEIIPLKEELSTTRIIEAAARVHRQGKSGWIEEEGAVYRPLRQEAARPAVFLDRDGTINREIHYLHEPEKFELLPGVIEALRSIQGMGYRLIVVTNQPGIGLGYYTKEDFFRVNLAMFKALSEQGILLDKVYFCPHSESEKCECRKPGQALVQRAVDELNVDLRKSWFVGDRPTDVETGKRAGMRTILLTQKEITKTEDSNQDPDYRCRDLSEAARKIKKYQTEQ